MKIIHLVSGNDIGGAKTHLITLLTELSKTIEILFVCLERGPSYDAAIKSGINVISLDQKGRYDLSILEKLKKIVKDGRYDILHCHGARANFIAIKIKKYIKIPISTTIHSDYKHDFDHNFVKKMLFTRINEKSLKKFDYYFTVTENFKKSFIDSGFSEKKIKIIYNGLSPDTFDKTLQKEKAFEDLRIEEDFIIDKSSPNKKNIIIGLAARLHPIKGVDVFLDSINQLKESNIKNFRVLIAGSGTEEEKYKKYVIDNKLSEYVKFLGFIDNMNEFYEICDINVLSSFSESFPYSLLEGGLKGKTTVASRVGGIPEMIEDGVDGLLFSSGSSKELKDSLEKLIKDEGLRLKLSTSFKQKILSKFSAESMAKTHIKIYDEIIKENPKKLALCGYYGYRNSGDDAILAAIIKSFKGLEREPDVWVLSKRPEITRKEYSCKSINRFDFSSVWKLLKDTDVLVMGGGSLLQDKTSNRSLYYYLGLMILALIRKVKVILYANGVGPIKSKINRFLTAWTLNRINILTIREKYSYDFVKSIGVDKPEIVITADPVFNLCSPEEQTDFSKIYEKENIKKDKPIVGVMFRSWKGEGNYAGKMSVICDKIIEKYDYQIVFVPMKFPADLKVSLAISKGMKNSSIVLENRYVPQEILPLIKDMKLVLGMRLHSVIYAGIYSVPFIGFEYDPKVAYYTHELGMPLIENLDDISVEKVLSYVDSILNSYEENTEKLKKRTEIMKKLAYENVDYIKKLL